MKRILLHMPVGFFAACCCHISWIFGFIFFAAFSLYEFNEDWHIRDRAYKDILGFLIGYSLGAVGVAYWMWRAA